jgi:hypothetical protein
VIALAIKTRIPMSEWVKDEWGHRAIATAYELLEDAKEVPADG